MNQNNFGEIFRLIHKNIINTKENLPDDLKCQKCQKLLYNCCQTKCGCRFCRDCVNEMISKDVNNCIGNKTECKDATLSEVTINHWANLTISNLILKCPSKSCLRECKLVEMYKHWKLCNKNEERLFESENNSDDLSNEKSEENCQIENFDKNKLFLEMINNIKHQVDVINKKENENRKQIDLLKQTLLIEMEKMKNEICVLKTEKDDLIQQLNNHVKHIIKPTISIMKPNNKKTINQMETTKENKEKSELVQITDLYDNSVEKTEEIHTDLLKEILSHEDDKEKIDVKPKMNIENQNIIKPSTKIKKLNRRKSIDIFNSTENKEKNELVQQIANLKDNFLNGKKEEITTDKLKLKLSKEDGKLESLKNEIDLLESQKNDLKEKMKIYRKRFNEQNLKIIKPIDRKMIDIIKKRNRNREKIDFVPLVISLEDNEKEKTDKIQTKPEETISNVNQEIKIIHSEDVLSNDISTRLSIIEKWMQNTIDKVFLWQVDKFGERRQKEEIIWSEYFYTKMQPYKLKLLLCPDTSGKQSSNDFSIFLQIHDDVFNNNLKWPFLANVTIKIIKDFHSKEFLYIKQNCNFEKPLFNEYRWSQPFDFVNLDYSNTSLSLEKGFYIECSINLS